MSAETEQKTPAVKAPKASKKAKKASAPPRSSFKEMIFEAIKESNDPAGMSRKAIRQYIEKNHAPKTVGTYLNKNLAKMIKDGQLTHPKKGPGKYICNVEKAEKKRKPAKKEVKKPAAAKKAGRPKKTAAQKKKSAKKSPAKKASQKKVVKAPPSPKKSAATGEAKRGRGRPKKAK